MKPAPPVTRQSLLIQEFRGWERRTRQGWHLRRVWHLSGREQVRLGRGRRPFSALGMLASPGRSTIKALDRPLALGRMVMLGRANVARQARYLGDGHSDDPLK